jgi:hypothetical protein
MSATMMARIRDDPRAIRNGQAAMLLVAAGRR